MKIKIQRPYYTLPELAQKWSLSGLDLQRAIMAGSVKPCVMLDEYLHPVAVVDGAPVVLREAAPIKVRKWLYPVYPVQIEPFNFRFEMLCDMAEPVEGCTLYGLPQPLTLVDLMGHPLDAVVMLEDMQQAEAALRPVGDDDDLATKEKNTLSRMLVTMYVTTYGWDPRNDDERSEGLTSLIRSAEGLGLPISYNTARKHLIACWERATPKDDDPAPAKVEKTV